MILITGASSGLGAALAALYAKDNQALTLTGRDANRLHTVANALSPFSQQAITAIAADLSDEASVEALFDGLTDSPATVIHCAGSGYFGALENQGAREIKTLLNNNVTSTILLVRELVKRYKNQAITVVVVMSTAALAAKAGESTYCAAKWAVRGFIESVRLELKQSPMKLIAVYPGGMDTGFWPSSGKSVDTSSFMSADEAAGMLKQALLATEHGYIADITIQRG
ncbi:SDR family NAD(P)-dependent oxidoreductase [Shewanella oneidensis MR-1]|uniref:Oxidoreductase short-chain dehydrogenase/reductase family n=1 Tax=Shewanella oneidensis (strain ATCC 700550 / JCM 31522 / CIP 106686 / LMG 19005 / NCIMB 14063 / MR-1) TaxID=211586 RepID=Q8EJF7_SHEON|nr:SDR family NAD(P)-dependent oxidoreductase [Shewanella oneidensis]AAN53591.1 oxidoreductase short-chain dehydrogenase/reductase family [Shewanella oneidensis MR-1]MDX5997551.1 SDR family NAD(P)-dependent oxidoreductase [Shewanella oneidensis]MEE2026799.1 Sepiapterin reductase [Shewanella oneidensis]QKG95423.1 SDR family NAD(P)-dependent oxidoreductase [Shewanella oneidensis MR-1]